MPTRQEALLLIRYQTSLRDSVARYSARQSLNADLAMSARFSGLEAVHDWESGFAFRHCGGHCVVQGVARQRRTISAMVEDGWPGR
jgi:hypothetical protein